MKFFSFWRSQASFRVRIALNLKGLPSEATTYIDLDTDQHHTDEFRRLNPQMALPTLIDDDGTVLTQSLAILEYLDEKHPAPPLLPSDLAGRARVRALALTVACDAHPFLVPRVRRYLETELKHGEPEWTAWRRHWTVETLAALEGYLASDKMTGRLCHGDAPTLADICLAGHVAVALMQQIDFKPYPVVKRLYETAMAIPAFASAHPLKQPDAPAAIRK